VEDHIHRGPANGVEMHDVVVIGYKVIELAKTNPAEIDHFEIENISRLNGCVHLQWLVNIRIVVGSVGVPPFAAKNDSDNENDKCNHHDYNCAPSTIGRRRFPKKQLGVTCRGTHDANHAKNENDAKHSQHDAHALLHFARADGGS